MKKAVKRPAGIAFRRKWWQLLILMLAFISAEAQDSARYSAINGYGFRYKRFGIDSVFMIPLYESNHTPYRAGALKYRRSDSSLYKYTGTQWLKVESSGSTAGIDTVYTMDDTVQVIETPTETYFTIINSPYTEVINDSTIVIGNDTLVIKGGVGGGGGSGGAWGTITGTLSDQTDLQNALDLKVDISDTSAMLSPYLRKADTTAMLGNYIRDANDGLTKTGQVVSIANNGVTNAKLAQGPARSVKGNSTNSTANQQDITSSTANRALTDNGTSLDWRQIDLTNTVTGALPNGNIAAFKTYPAEKSLGVIYEKSQWSDVSADFLPNPSGTNLLSISTGYLNSSAAAFSYNNYVRILPGRPTDMNRWKMTVRFRNTAWSANSFEFGVGIYSAVTHSGATFGYIAFLQSTSSGSGNLFIYDQSGSTQRATGSGAVTYSLNDDIELTYTYNDTTLVFTAQNITTGGTLRTATYTFPANMSVILPNNGNWGLFEGNGGTGTHQVRYIKIESLETQNPNLLIIGNSKTKGYYADFYNLRFPSQLNSTYPTTIWNAGSAERLTDMISRLDEFTQLNPSQVILADAASNQLRAGTSITETARLYDILVQTFEAGGTPVYHIVLPEDSTGGGIGQTAWNAYLIAKYGTRVIQEVYDDMSTNNVADAAMINADDVHLSQAGHNQVATSVIASGKITTISTQRRTPYRTHDDVVKFTGDSLHFKWKVRSRGNFVPRWSTNLDELTTGPLYMDSVSLIASTSTRPTKPLSTMFASFEGAVAAYGATGSYFNFDRTTPANYYAWFSDANTLQFLYNGTNVVYMGTDGRIRIGNGSSVSSAVIPGLLQLRANRTFTGTQGRLGVALNIDTMSSSMPNTGHTFFAANSIAPHTITSTSSGNTTTATNFYIDDSVVAGTNHAITGTSYAFYINKGKTRLGTTDSVGTATGGFLFKDFTTGDVRLTAAPSGSADGNGIYSGSGALSGATDVTGGGANSLNLGTAGSKLSALTVNSGTSITLTASAYVQLFGGVQISGGVATDANYTIPDNVSYITLPEITADRNVTMPQQGAGKMYIIHNKNVSANNWNVVGNLVNAAGTAITTITNVTVYIIISDGTNFIQIN